MTVFLTTNNTGLDFEDDVERGAFLEQGFGQSEVFLQRQLGGI